MARIGIIGAQGVGKTTLINALLEEEEFKEYTHVPSPTRYLKKMFGMDFNNANTEIQLATLCLQALNVSSHSNAFFDRTVIDNYAYLQYHAGRGNSDLSANALNFIQYISLMLANKLDLIFIIYREFDLVSDGIRNIDPKQQKEIEDRIVINLQEYHIDINKIIALSGSVEQRVLSVKQAYSKYILKGE